MSQIELADTMNSQNEEWKFGNYQLDLIYVFVCRMAKELYLLMGIETPYDALAPIAKNLFSINPDIWKNEEIILKTLTLGDFQFRQPKQLIPDDFTVTLQKLKRVQDAGELWYNQTRLSSMLADFETKQIALLNSQIEDLKEQIRLLEFRWMKEPEPLTKLGWSAYTERMHEIEDEKFKLSDKCTSQEIQIRKLQSKVERLTNKPKITSDFSNSSEKSNENEEENNIKNEKNPEIEADILEDSGIK